MCAQEAQEKTKPREKARRHKKKGLIFLVIAVALTGISFLLAFAGIGVAGMGGFLQILIAFCIFAFFIIGVIYLISGFVRKD